MSRGRVLTFVPLAAALAVGFAHSATAQTTWIIDNTSSIGGNAVTTIRGAPTKVDTPLGKALKFDGDDGIIVNANPAATATSFTIEMLFRPDTTLNVNSNQPRMLHLQSAVPPDHRATMEARIAGGQWTIDTFLKTNNSLTLLAPSVMHPLNKWYNYAMTYDGTTLKSWVNGSLDASGALSTIAMATGQTSLGMRATATNCGVGVTSFCFFEGVIAKVRFTSSIVAPANFMNPIPGDYDKSGVVDVADYDVWKAAVGTGVGASGAGADGNFDGVIDDADYTVWRDNLPVVLGGASTVPEPATIYLFALALLGLGLHARRRMVL